MFKKGTPFLYFNDTMKNKQLTLLEYETRPLQFCMTSFDR